MPLSPHRRRPGRARRLRSSRGAAARAARRLRSRPVPSLFPHLLLGRRQLALPAAVRHGRARATSAAEGSGGGGRQAPPWPLPVPSRSLPGPLPALMGPSSAGDRPGSEPTDPGAPPPAAAGSWGGQARLGVPSPSAPGTAQGLQPIGSSPVPRFGSAPAAWCPQGSTQGGSEGRCGVWLAVTVAGRWLLPHQGPQSSCWEPSGGHSTRLGAGEGL